MGIFNKAPKKLTLDEILKGIEALTEEEQKKVNEALNGNAKVENESETETNTETVVEDNAPAPVTEQEQPEGEENPENTETDETETNETPEEPETPEAVEGEGDGEPVDEYEANETEVNVEGDGEEAEETEETEETETVGNAETLDALYARFTALEEEHAKLAEKYDELYALLEEREKNANFGVAPEVPENEDDNAKANKSVYTAYAGKNAHKYF